MRTTESNMNIGGSYAAWATGERDLEERSSIGGSYAVWATELLLEVITNKSNQKNRKKQNKESNQKSKKQNKEPNQKNEKTK